MDDGIDKYSQFIFYQGEDGSVKIQVILGDETIWATQSSIAEIFDTTKQNVSYHLSNIFKEGELIEYRVVKEILTTASDGKNYNTRFYNLDAIISIGYRISSSKATIFRIWATGVLKEYMIKGFALDDERLKQGGEAFGKDYFEELLERIREIRSSERLFYQKITDLYMTARDYDANSETTKNFYATVQNKLHWAIHHHTAAELIKLRANANEKNMGLTSWKNEKRGGKILKSDVRVAKNYLTENELIELNRVVSMYLDFAENLAKRHKIMYMNDWARRLDSFLEFNEYNILDNAGKISKDVAKSLAEKEYEKFRIVQDREYRSDFDKVVDDIKITGKLPKKISEFGVSLSDMLNKQNYTDFDNKLNRALNFNPNKDNKKKNKDSYLDEEFA